MVIVVISIVGVFVGGYMIAQLRPDFQIPATATVGRDRLMTNFHMFFQMAADSPQSVVAAVVQNGRVLLAASLLAVFTFGVMGIFFAIVPFGILGFLLGQPALAALGIGTFLAAVVPHSLVEIPAAVIAAAAAVRLGTVVTR